MVKDLMNQVSSRLGDGFRRMPERTANALGMPPAELARRVPSFLRGSWEQSKSTVDRPAQFVHRGGPAVMLVPGMFCTPSTMNRLGYGLESLGADVYVPKRFPYYGGPLANTGAMDDSTEILLESLAQLESERGVHDIRLACHSLGGLIALCALARAARQGVKIPRVESLVTMATPFRGCPSARALRHLLPAARGFAPGAELLDALEPQWGRVTRALVAGYDAVVPAYNQRPDAVESIYLPGFQHMDFVVGTPARIQRTAALIAETIPGLYQPSAPH